MSKVLEIVMDRQLRSFIEDNNILPQMQSGFCSGHSCETALLNVSDDIFRGLYQGYITVLIIA